LSMAVGGCWFLVAGFWCGVLLTHRVFLVFR
jgi:hypothetical protein